MGKKKTKNGDLTIRYPFGLFNLGATCYLNSVIQILFNNEDFIFLFSIIDSFIGGNAYQFEKKYELSEALHKSIKAISTVLNSSKKEQDYSIKLKTLISKMEILDNNFSAYRENDAAEFMLRIFSRLEDELEAYMKEKYWPSLSSSISVRNNSDKATTDKNPLKEAFLGRTTYSFICSSCNHIFQLNESFYILDVDVIPSSKSGLENGIQDHFKEETMMDYKCEKCNETNVVKKIPKLSSLPRTLFIQIKRYQITTSSDGAKLTKDNSFVKYNKFLKIKGVSFILEGFVIHEGSLQSGHYYAFVFKNNKWYKINDTRIIPCKNEDVVLKQKPIILLYRRFGGIR